MRVTLLQGDLFENRADRTDQDAARADDDDDQPAPDELSAADAWAIVRPRLWALLREAVESCSSSR